MWSGTNTPSKPRSSALSESVSASRTDNCQIGRMTPYFIAASMGATLPRGQRGWQPRASVGRVRLSGRHAGGGLTKPLDPLLAELEQFGQTNDRSSTERPRRMLNITRDTGELLAVLVRATAARRGLGNGTAHGYSALVPPGRRPPGRRAGAPPRSPPAPTGAPPPAIAPTPPP